MKLILSKYHPTPIKADILVDGKIVKGPQVSHKAAVEVEDGLAKNIIDYYGGMVAEFKGKLPPVPVHHGYKKAKISKARTPKIERPVKPVKTGKKTPRKSVPTMNVVNAERETLVPPETDDQKPDFGTE
jgi:hypothetical protein